MIKSRIRAALLAGTASLTVTAAVSANDYSSFIVFGDRTLDAGQYIDSDGLAGNEIQGDGRRRFTNRLKDGNYGAPYSDLVSNHQAFGTLNPSQPTTADDIPTPTPGLNYAASFNRTSDVLESISGNAYRIRGIIYSIDGQRITVPGVTRPGLLRDPERSANAWNALVLVNGGTRDIRDRSNIERDLDGNIDLNGSYIDLSPAANAASASNAANNIVTGVNALTNAGAKLVVVPTIMDLGQIPETPGDVTLLAAADTALVARETEAANADATAVAAEAQAQTAVTIAADAVLQLQNDEDALERAENDPTSSQATLASLRAQVVVATNEVATTSRNADNLTQTAADRRAAADAVALTPHEAQLRPQINAAIADPTLIARNRTAGTAAYNAALSSGLRGRPGVLLIDQNALFAEVIADPERFGLTAAINQAETCDFSNVLYECTTADSSIAIDKQLFSSGIDLTTTGHELAADQINAVLDAPVAISAAPFAAMSAGRVVANTVRGQVTPERIRKRGWAPFVSGGAGSTKITSIENEGNSEFQTFTGTAGVTFTPVAGIALGIAAAYQDIDEQSGDNVLGYRGTGMFGSVYAGADFGRVFANASASVGTIDYDGIDRHTYIGAADIVNSGKTEADVYGGGVEVGVRIYNYDDIITLGPIASVDHWSSEMDGYTEDGWGVTSIQVSDLEGSSTRGSVGMFVEAGDLDYAPMPVAFRGKALYTHEFETDGTPVTASLTSNPGGTFTRLGRGASENAVTLGMQLSYKLGRVIGSVGYDGRVGDEIDHYGRVDVSVPIN